MRLFFAYVIKPHSIHGEVELNTKEYDILSIGDNLYTEDGINCYKIINIKTKPSKIVLKFEGIDSRDMADTLRNVELFIDTDEILIENDDSYFIGELIGMDVIDSENNKVGIVEDCYETKAHTILEIRTSENKRVDIPFVSRYVSNLDKDKSMITIVDFDTFLE